jgi:hypothetical protein
MVGDLGYLGLTPEEAAGVFSITLEQFNALITDPDRPEFADAWHGGLSNLALDLRRKQIELALGTPPSPDCPEGRKPDKTMLKWLGTQHLGQGQRSSATTRSELTVTHQYIASWGKTPPPAIAPKDDPIPAIESPSDPPSDPLSDPPTEDQVHKFYAEYEELPADPSDQPS